MTSLSKIVIFGGGLAGHMTALALSELLPKTIGITFVKTEDANAADIFFGTVTSPSTYDFLLSLGISEPELLLGTDTSFSLGTQFSNWGVSSRNWTQAFHKPLPIPQGVKFQHYVSCHNKGSVNWTLDPYVMSVEAANKGVFAHPPEGKNIPLATVEYGYHFTPQHWTELLSKKLLNSCVEIITGEIKLPKENSCTLDFLTLQDGQQIDADMFIDCTGQTVECEGWTKSRPLRAVSYDASQDNLDGVVRTVTETDHGWKAETPLRGRVNLLHVYDPQDELHFTKTNNLKDTTSSDIKLGCSNSPWKGNVLKLGHGAGALAPLTPAPIMALQRDIERLVELIPTSANMTVEAREYNRRFVQDFGNAAMFHRGLFDAQTVTLSSYRKAVMAEPVSAQLQTKITQFESRGIYVLFDNELFTEQDWTLLHIGMGRMPARYDPLTDRVSEAQITQMLDNMSRANSQMGAKMPPHQVYMTGLLKFLKEKHG